ncbi:helix-turn-helix domain-containing protein [Streptomyces sp. NBC_01283]|uniref:GlxA family transcriptional regulator n=1 Tax=Streptomyces sp. NBC_01283 TaxID=2903812 RepID=UPI00352E2073|nr:helix-turn-helix domain-containing protein [Streptomyces sp. NBC_01283]
MSVIAVLALDGVPGHQLTAPALAFATAARHHPTVAYDLRIRTGPGFRATGGPGSFHVEADRGLEGLAGLGGGDTVLLPGHAGFREAPAPEVVDALRAAVAGGCRIGAVGTGTFTLAATGLLDGRRAATSRRHTAELAGLHPRIEVDPEGAAVADGPFHSAAGVLGGIDLCLHLITLDHGEPVAIETERQVFLQLHSPAVGLASDASADVAFNAVTRPGSAVEPTTRWMEANLHHPLTLTEIAAHAGVGVRSLTRRFRAETGLTPLQYLLRARIQRAQRLLERTDDPVERIAARTGLGTPANLRHHFQRLTGTSPSTYRGAFRSMVADLTWPERRAGADGDSSGHGASGG